MKKNYNPYTVPEGFFRESKSNSISLYAKRSRTLKYAFLSVAVAAILIVIPVFVRQSTENLQPSESERVVNTLAQMYDYDIFLQVNF